MEGDFAAGAGVDTLNCKDNRKYICVEAALRRLGTLDQSFSNCGPQTGTDLLFSS